MHNVVTAAAFRGIYHGFRRRRTCFLRPAGLTPSYSSQCRAWKQKPQLLLERYGTAAVGSARKSV